MSEIYTPDEFAKCYQKRGYGARRDALNWLKERGAQEARESDFQRCYQALEERKVPPYRGRTAALRGDGRNTSDPELTPNSKGLSFDAIIRREERRYSNGK